MISGKVSFYDRDLARRNDSRDIPDGKVTGKVPHLKRDLARKNQKDRGREKTSAGQIRVDGGGGAAASAHGEDDRGGASDSIAAGEDAGT